MCIFKFLLWGGVLSVPSAKHCNLTSNPSICVASAADKSRSWTRFSYSACFSAIRDVRMWVGRKRAGGLAEVDAVWVFCVFASYSDVRSGRFDSDISRECTAVMGGRVGDGRRGWLVGRRAGGGVT